LDQNDRQVILVKSGASGSPSNVPSNIGRQGQSPSSFPTSPSGGRPSRPVSGVNPAGAGGGSGAPEFDDQCPGPKKEQRQESSTNHHDFTQKSKKKKKRNHHLNQQIEVNGEIFQFERDQIEKKAPSHGTDFGLEPDYGPDGEMIRDRKTGKPRAKQNKENYQKFTDNLLEFVKDPKSERIEPQYRKGRENEQDAVGFLN
jgi:hypothetical protein